MVKEFVEFLKQYGVLGLAMAVILGGKINDLVSSLVNDLLMPALFQPALHAAKVDNIRALSYHGILYGKVLGSFIDFMVVAILIFAFSKLVLRALPHK